MNETKNYKFRKPTRKYPADPADIDDINYNSDSIDSILTVQKGEIDGLEAKKADRTELELKEPVFDKNTAFNKSFGSLPGMVCEGNDERLSNARPASDVSEWAKAKEKPTYNKAEIGLSEVDNIASADMPLSALQKKYIDESIATAGGGDMLKSVYDVNGDGVVDAASSLRVVTF